MTAFADVEALVVDHLETVTGTRTVTKLPELLEAAMPIYRVGVVGGVDDKLTDRARIQVESFAATRADSADLAEVAREAMHGLAHTVVAGWLVDTTETLSRPMWVDYANDHVQRFVATYQVDSRIRVG